MTKEEAVRQFVERDFSAIPQEWVQIIAEHEGEYPSLPMWGTMWIMDFTIWGEKLWNASKEMSAENFKDDYDEEIDGQYIIGVNGAGWDFYHGVWDKLYDFFGLEWHDEEAKTA